MAHLISNIPHFKCWVRREFTHNHEKYHGEYLHALAIAVNTIPDRSLSFQVVFTGEEANCEDWDEGNIHGGAMWARMPITGLVSDTPSEEFPVPMSVHDAQPWDCSSHHNSVYVIDRATPCPWLAKIDGKMFPAKYYFTVDYAENEIADDSAQHKQSHVLYITEDCEWQGNFVALPNNRVRATSPALWVTGEGAPDFRPSQYSHSAEGHDSYMDPTITFNNLYDEKVSKSSKK